MKLIDEPAFALPQGETNSRGNRSVYERYKPEFLQAYMIRAVEDKLLALFREGRIFGTVHTCIGQEFSPVMISRHLEAGDVIFSNHRCHGHYLARTGDVRALIAELMGRKSGVCKGVGGSQHLCAEGFYSNGIQGGILPVGAGIALHHKLRGDQAVSVVYMGDGTLGEGVVYETFNIVSKWNLPQLTILEDNQYAQSTASRDTLAGSISGRAHAFGIAYFEASIWDLPDLDVTAAAAVRYVRSGNGPALLRVKVYRLGAHSKGDDYRDPAEIAAYRQADPLNCFLEQEGKQAAIQRALADVNRVIDASVEDASRDDVHTLLGPDAADLTVEPVFTEVAPEGLIQIDAIYAALDDFLRTYPDGVLLGEDIHAPYGGAFKACRDLSERYPERVLTTPISEAALVGIANGLALMANRAVVEIMFGDFVTLAFDQIVNHAAKFHLMYGAPKPLRLAIRMPMGGGRGYGPTHSQCLEKHLAGVPGTQMFILHGRTRVKAFYSALFARSETPSIVIEHKTLYAYGDGVEIPKTHIRLETDEEYPTTLLKTRGDPDITVVAFGQMSRVAEEVAQQLYADEEILVEIVLPLLVYPLSIGAVLASVKKTGRLVVIEEGTQGFDLGAEIVATVATNWREREPLRARRLAAKANPIPSPKPLERAVLPSADDLYRVCIEIYP
jgi:2-oxoisovalerate dehydrogenase E1 component